MRHSGRNFSSFELKVLDAVWTLGTATVREVVRDGKLWQTYPTIMTTMDRIFKKGLLSRGCPTGELSVIRHDTALKNWNVQRP